MASSGARRSRLSFEPLAPRFSICCLQAAAATPRLHPKAPAATRPIPPRSSGSPPWPWDGSVQRLRILFDDFGTGYASLSYLKKFPLDGLKIDRSFVFGLLSNSDDAAIVGSTIGLSKQLGLTVVAEGIENRATADFLVSMGCEGGQGYFFGRPMPAEAFEKQFLAAELAAVSAA
ncbi:hypothetical protein ABIA06_002697 [Bradyrhizobium yuanmingense]